MDGGPSETARRVAAHRLGFSRQPAAYGDPAADEAPAVLPHHPMVLHRGGYPDGS